MKPRVHPTFHLMLTIRCLFQVSTNNGACLLMYFLYAHSCTRVLLSWVVCAGKNRRGKLVHWVEKASFAKIRRLLEISKQERHHEVLLTMKNLHDLSCHPSPYSVPIIPRPLPSEVVEGEHFVAADLLSLIPSSSSPAVEAESKAAGREVVIITQPAQPSSISEDSSPAPQASRKVEGGSRLERPALAIKNSHPATRASNKRRGR